MHAGSAARPRTPRVDRNGPNQIRHENPEIGWPRSPCRKRRVSRTIEKTRPKSQIHRTSDSSGSQVEARMQIALLNRVSTPNSCLAQPTIRSSTTRTSGRTRSRCGSGPWATSGRWHRTTGAHPTRASRPSATRRTLASLATGPSASLGFRPTTTSAPELRWRDKNQTAKKVKTGNHIPGWDDEHGAMARRLVVFLYEQKVDQPAHCCQGAARAQGDGGARRRGSACPARQVGRAGRERPAARRRRRCTSTRATRASAVGFTISRRPTRLLFESSALEQEVLRADLWPVCQEAVQGVSVAADRTRIADFRDECVQCGDIE